MGTKEGIEPEVEKETKDFPFDNSLEDSERRRALRKRAAEIERNLQNF